MMGRRSSAEVYAPHSPITSFAGQDGTSRLQKEYLLECESIPYNYLSGAAALAFSTHEPFFNTAPTFDGSPPLLPANNPHYYVPFHQPPQYSPGLIERDDRVTLAGGGRIGQKLGQRTYFSSSDGLLSRPMAMCSAPAHLLPPRCQVEGCGADLSAAKNYHRRHKVCNFHSKASAVVAHGLHQRFCQQCSRFHVLAEFDEAKRSCRKRLADHNRRRRKPQLISAAATTPPTAKSKGTTAVPACPTTVSAQEIQLRDEQGLSQGRRDMSCNSMSQTEAVLIGAAVEEDKLSQQQHAQSFPISESNSSFFTHQKGPDFNDALLVIGGDASSHRASPHLGQFMFELDFL